MPFATLPWWKSVSIMNENKGVQHAHAGGTARGTSSGSLGRWSNCWSGRPRARRRSVIPLRPRRRVAFIAGAATSARSSSSPRCERALEAALIPIFRGYDDRMARVGMTMRRAHNAVAGVDRAWRRRRPSPGRGVGVDGAGRRGDRGITGPPADHQRPAPERPGSGTRTPRAGWCWRTGGVGDPDGSGTNCRLETTQPGG